MDIILVAAIAENGVIGRGNALPWRIKSDLQYFRAMTIGRPVVMGRKTYLSIGTPLKGRTNIVVSRDPDFTAPGVVACTDLSRALDIARDDALRRGVREIAIIGGTDIFVQTMPLASRLVLTLVHARPEGDAYFPVIDPELWLEGERREQPKGPQDDYNFTFVDYDRRARHERAL